MLPRLFGIVYFDWLLYVVSILFPYCFLYQLIVGTAFHWLVLFVSVDVVDNSLYCLYWYVLPLYWLVLNVLVIFGPTDIAQIGWHYLNYMAFNLLAHAAFCNWFFQIQWWLHLMFLSIGWYHMFCIAFHWSVLLLLNCYIGKWLGMFAAFSHGIPKCDKQFSISICALSWVGHWDNQ